MSHRPVRLNSSGLTLIEIMIALAVGGVLTYLVYSMTSNVGKQATAIANKNDFVQFGSELQSLFNNADRCKAAFASTNPNSFIPPLKDLGPVGAPTTHPLTIKLNTGNADPLKGPLGPGLTVGSKYGNTLTIKAFEFRGMKPIGGNSQYSVSLHLAVSRRVGDGKSGSENTVGGDILHRTFNLTVGLDRSKETIIGCAGQYIDFWKSTGPAMLDIIYRDGAVGLEEAATGPDSKLGVGGSTQADVYQYQSDARLKKNIRGIPSALDRISGLHGVLFRWRDPLEPSQSEDQLGFVAQEVEKVFPEVVSTDSRSGLKSVAYANLMAPLIEALKERQRLLVSRQTEIDALKKALRQ